MTEILLISEKFVKDNTSLSDNINSKTLLPAIREAQEIGLREILGDRLLDALKNAAEDGIDKPENLRFKNILINAQFYLAYQVVADICFQTAVKIDNAGILRVVDERMESVSLEEVSQVRGYWQKRADFYKMRLQQYLTKNSSQYPELCSNGIGIQSNLFSASSAGLWLGGARGRSYYGRCLRNDSPNCGCDEE